MQTTAEQILTTLEPSDTTAWVKVSPGNLSAETLATLARLAEPTGGAKELRRWLQVTVAAETNRRLIDGHYSDVPRECESWQMPWHRWRDDELAEAIGASYSWTTMRLGNEAEAVIDKIHRTVVAIAACRLRELHSAIMAMEANR